jgi:excisionase family DNA binding protein
MSDEALDDIKETHRWTALPLSWIYSQTAAGTMPHYKVGKYLRFRRSEVRAWLEQHRRGPSVEATGR